VKERKHVMRMVEMSPDWQFLTCRLAVLALTFLTECGCGGADTPASSLRFLEVSFNRFNQCSGSMTF
jgi:hypothetical protein